MTEQSTTLIARSTDQLTKSPSTIHDNNSSTRIGKSTGQDLGTSLKPETRSDSGLIIGILVAIGIVLLVVIGYGTNKEKKTRKSTITRYNSDKPSKSDPTDETASIDLDPNKTDPATPPPISNPNTTATNIVK